MALKEIGFTLADLHATALRKIKEEYADQLSEDEYKILLETKSPSQVLEHVPPEEYEAGKGRRVLESSLVKLERFDSAIDQVTGSMPELMGFNLVGMIWGGMKLALVVAKDFVETYNVILDTIDSITGILPTHDIYQKLFATSDIQLLAAPITEMYGLLLEFAIMAIGWGSKGVLGKMGSSTARSMQDRFAELKGRIEAVSLRIEKMTMLEFMNKTSNQFESQDAKLDNIKREIQLFSARSAALAEPVEDGKTKRVSGTPLQLLSRYFTGRDDELKRLNTILYESEAESDEEEGEEEDEDSEIKTAVIVGMHGLGKSQVAIKFADSTYRTRKVDYVFWISASTEQKLKHDFASILDLIEHRERFNTDEDKKLIAARRWLEEYEPVEEGSSRGWLLVFDNVNSATVETLREILPRQQSHGCGRILMTTRSTTVAEEFETPDVDGEHIVELQTMNVDDSVKILLRKKKDKGAQTFDREEAEEIVKKIGLLPVAIDQAAAFMAKGKKSTGDLLKIYEEEDDRIEILSWRNNLAKYEEKSVVATFRSSYNELSSSDPAAAELFRALLFFDPEGIELSLIREGAGVWSAGEIDWEKWDWWSWREFKGHTLAERGEDEGGEMEKSLDKEKKMEVPAVKRKSRFRRMFGLSRSKRKETPPPPSEPAKASKTPPKEKVEEPKPEDPALLEKLSKMPLDGPLKSPRAEALLKLFSSPIKFQDALSTLEELSLIKLIDSKIVTNELVHFIIRSFLDKPTLHHWLHFDVCLLRGYLNNLSSTKDRTNWPKYQVAVPHILKLAFTGFSQPEKQTGKQLWFLLRIIYKYLEAQMRERQCIPILEPFLRELSDSLGNDHAATLDIRLSLAFCYLNLGDYSKSLREMELVKIGHAKLYAADNVAVLGIDVQISHVKAELGDLQSALHLCQTALAGLEKVYGAYHPLSLTALELLAYIYKKQYKYEKAASVLEKVVPGLTKAFTADYYVTLVAMTELGDIYNETSNYTKAVELLTKACEGFEKAVGREHFYFTDARTRLGQTYFRTGEYEEALKIWEETLAVLEEEREQEDINTLDLIHNIASAYAAEGEHQKALSYFERALEGYKKLKGESDSSCFDTILAMSSVYDNLDEFDKALSLATEAYEGNKSKNGEFEAPTLRALNNVAFLHSRMGDYEKAIDINGKVLEGLYKCYGKDASHKDIRQATDNQADYYAAVANWEKAAEWYAKGAVLYEKTYGADHEYTKSVKQDVEEMRRRFEAAKM